MRRALVTAVLLASLGCSNHDRTSTADEYIVDCAANDTQFASDENYVKMIEAEAARRVVADPCKSPELLSPVDSSIRLSPGAPPTFIFNPIHTCAAANRSSNPVQGCSMKKNPAPAWLSALKFGASLLEGTAEAHCGAMSGENYLLRVTRTGDSTPLYTAMLSVTSFTPDAGIWRRALSGRTGQTVSVTILRSVFLRGSINEGPYVQPQPYSFTIGP
jgi:hypothetical protein